MTDSSDHAKTVQGSRIGVALFLFRATFSFSPSRPLIGEASKRKFFLACMYARINESIYIFIFIFLLFLFYQKKGFGRNAL